MVHGEGGRTTPPLDYPSTMSFQSNRKKGETMEKVEDRLKDHEYDGITEYDNPTPGWWNLLFIASFVFSVLYFVHYQLGHGASVADEYTADVEEAKAIAAERALASASKEVTEETLGALASSPDQVAKGKAKFLVVCAACHGQRGEGLVGPNLTDGQWLHGDGSLMAIRKVVREGVIAKGMAAWESQMPPEELLQVVAYVGTLRGTNVPGKPPEGEKTGPQTPEDNKLR